MIWGGQMPLNSSLPAESKAGENDQRPLLRIRKGRGLRGGGHRGKGVPRPPGPIVFMSNPPFMPPALHPFSRVRGQVGDRKSKHIKSQRVIQNVYKPTDYDRTHCISNLRTSSALL